VTAGRFAADRSNKRAAALANLPRLFRQKATSARDEEEVYAGDSQQHAKRLAPAFPKMPLQRCWSRFAVRSERGNTLLRECRPPSFALLRRGKQGGGYRGAQLAQDFHFLRNGLT
jgi:hypothetical protein